MCDSHDHHDESHSHSDGEMGIRYSLYEKIDLENVQCLNEVSDGSGKLVFKPWECRCTMDTYVESDDDPELLFNIPFTGNVKLKGIIIFGGQGLSHPSKMRLYKNRPYMSFDDITIQADQEFDLQEDYTATFEYSLSAVKFSSTNNLSIFFPSNFGAEKTRVYYIGLRGEFTPFHRHGVTLCVYESRPMIDDHKVKNMDSVPEVL